MQSSPELLGFPINKGITEKNLKEVGQKITKGLLPVPKGKTDAKSVEESPQAIQKASGRGWKKAKQRFQGRLDRQ